MTETPMIRPSTPADDHAVGELLVRAYATQYARKLPDVVMPAERIADLRNQAEKRETATVLVAELDGRIVGTVALYRWGSPRSEAWIEGAADLRFFALDVAFQGRGLSPILLDAATALAKDWRAPAICLHVRRGADGIARLYQAHGYIRDEAGDLDHLPVIFLDAYVQML